VLRPQQLYEWLEQRGVRFFAGVPDSLLKDFCAYVNDHTPADRHVITANEGGAIALAMGRHLATGEVALVYMQNSGLGNTVNPITSLAAPAVYGIPMVLVVGWRGEPGKKDEPQHVHMGRVTRDTLEAIGVPHVVLPVEAEAAEAVVAEALERARRESSPVALVVRKGSFESYQPTNLVADRYAMTREQAIEAMVDALPDDAAVVSTTGKPSRELFEVRAARGQPHRDFLTVGGMGHASQIALGAALGRDERPLYCLDGDGAVLMHLGGLSTIGTLAPKNFKHVVVNNGAHDSVGGQPTVGFEVDLCAVAMACGYRRAVCVSEPDSLKAALAQLRDEPGPAMVEVRVCKGGRADLGRPTMTPQDLKRAIMDDLSR
jgi:phosphonopyruvate decarboxylase